MQPGWPRRLAPACHSAPSAEFNHNSHGLSPKANAPWSEQALHREGGGQRAWQTPGLGSPRHGLSRDRLWHIGALRDGTGDTEGWIEAPGAGVSSPSESWAGSHPSSAFLCHQQVAVVCDHSSQSGWEFWRYVCMCGRVLASLPHPTKVTCTPIQFKHTLNTIYSLTLTHILTHL